MTRRGAWMGGAVLVLVLALAMLWVWGDAPGVWQALLARVAGWGPWIGVGLIGLMVVHNVVPVPAEVIAVTAGALLGVVHGVAVIWTGAMLGAVLAFWVARRFGRGVLRRGRAAAALARFDAVVAAGDWRGLLLARLIPVVSFNLVNYGAGLAGVGWGRFLWTTGLGILPLTVLSVAAGAGMHAGGWAAVLGVAAVLALGGLALRAYLRRAG